MYDGFALYFVGRNTDVICKVVQYVLNKRKKGVSV